MTNMKRRGAGNGGGGGGTRRGRIMRSRKQDGNQREQKRAGWGRGGLGDTFDEDSVVFLDGDAVVEWVVGTASADEGDCDEGMREDELGRAWKGKGVRDKEETRWWFTLRFEQSLDIIKWMWDRERTTMMNMNMIILRIMALIQWTPMNDLHNKRKERRHGCQSKSIQLRKKSRRQNNLVFLPYIYFLGIGAW